MHANMPGPTLGLGKCVVTSTKRLNCTPCDWAASREPSPRTHRNIEVVVVGDAAPPETAGVIERVGDAPSRARELLGWNAQTHAPELAQIMIKPTADLVGH
jgi:hypothetical protein